MVQSHLYRRSIERNDIADCIDDNFVRGVHRVPRLWRYKSTRSSPGQESFTGLIAGAAFRPIV